jgi:ribosomal protein S18 acetylase RimI-like enzyme
VIREIILDEDIRASVHVIRESFATVAAEFGLTFENCPSNAAFVTEDDLRKMREKGSVLFGLFDAVGQTGFVALRKASDVLFYLEKLAVLPLAGHSGHGKRLVDFSAEYVRKAGGQTISIGIIDENTRLKSWYIDCGFHETEIKRFPHLPFTVCILEKSIKSIS